jgi:hypothetical protein
MSKAHEKAAQQVELLDCSPKLLPRAEKGIPCDDLAKAQIIERLRHGQTLWGMLNENPELPSINAIAKAAKADPQFAADMQEARDIGNVARIEEGIDFQGSVRGNKHLSIAAEKYVNSAIKVAEKLSPKTMGQLIKHADADGNKLTVNVMRFEIAPPKAEPKALEVLATDVPKDRLLGAEQSQQASREKIEQTNK